MVFMRATPFFY